MSEWLSPCVIATALTTAAATLVALVPMVRTSQFQRLMLLLCIAFSGGMAAWYYHLPWLFPVIVGGPALVALMEGNHWAAWARISGVCLVQCSIVLLLCDGCARLSALVRRQSVFFRTPKTRGRHSWHQAQQTTTHEVLLCLLFAGIGILVIIQAHGAIPLPAILLIFQALCYGITPVFACLAEGSQHVPSSQPVAIAVHHG